MNLKIKVFLSFVLALFLTCSVFAKDSTDYLNTSEYNVKEKIKSINSKDYPDASYIILEDVGKIDLDKEGNYTDVSYNLSMILTDIGKKIFGTKTFSYDSKYQNIESIKIKIYLPDGTVKEIPQEDIKDGTSAGLQRMNIYETSMRVKTAVIGELPVGAAVETVTVTKTKRLIKDNYLTDWYFQLKVPVLHSYFEITAPTDFPLYTKVNNGEVKFSKEGNSEKTIYSWEKENIPQIKDEAVMPNVSDVALSLSVTTFKNWKEASRYYYGLNRDKYIADKAIRAKVAELIANCNTEDEKILAIHRFISQKIRYMGSAMDENAYIEAHPAPYTFEKGYGVCRDKALLMTTMMREAKIKCCDVLINPSTETSPDSPTVLFAHVVCLITTKDKRQIIMDPTTELSSGLGTSYAGERYVLPITADGSDIMKVPPCNPSSNAGKIRTKGILNEDLALNYEYSIDSCGDYEMNLRHVKQRFNTEQFKRVMTSVFETVSPAIEINDVECTDPSDLNTPFKLAVKATAPNYGTKAGKFVLVPLPERNLPFDSSVKKALKSLTDSDERQYDISLGTPDECIIEGTLEIPSNYRILSLPPNIDKKGEVDIKCSLSEDGKTIKYYGRKAKNTRYVSKDKYQEMKQLGIELKEYQRYMIILEKI